LLAFALGALAGSVFAAETKSPPPAAAKETARKEAEARKEADAKSSQQSVMKEFKEQADRFNKDHDELAKQLKTATEDQRKAIIEKMAERKKEFDAKLNALHKQMRDDQRKERTGSKR
jgi:hypothetical protein